MDRSIWFFEEQIQARKWFKIDSWVNRDVGSKGITGTLVKIQLAFTGRKESGRVICQENRDRMDPIS